MGPIPLSTTVSVNHRDCSAGVDTRQRLYITVKAPGQYLCYCHNCGEGGVVRDGGPSIHLAKPAAPGVPEELRLPEGLVTWDASDFPGAAEDFLRQIPNAAAYATTGLGWDRESGRLILPIHRLLSGNGGIADTAEELLGWQARRLWGSGPKYLTVESDACAQAGMEAAMYLWGETQPKVLVLVEDWLSALHVAQSTQGAYVVPLFRFKIAAERLARLRKDHDNLFVWLDNDKPEVKDEVKHITALWRALGGQSEATGYTDPKHQDAAMVRGRITFAVEHWMKTT